YFYTLSLHDALPISNRDHSGYVRDFVGAGKEFGDCTFHLHTLLVDGAVAKILGISAFYHDSAACLVIDGEIIAAAQEERFTRVKDRKSTRLNSSHVS